MSYVLFQIRDAPIKPSLSQIDRKIVATIFNNAKDMFNNVMSRVWCCKQYCTEVFSPELAHCHQYLIQLFEGGYD